MSLDPIPEREITPDKEFVRVRLTPECEIEVAVPTEWAREGWGVRPGGPYDVKYRVPNTGEVRDWATWSVNFLGEVHAWRLPTLGTESHSRRIVSPALSDKQNVENRAGK